MVPSETTGVEDELQAEDDILNNKNSTITDPENALDGNAVDSDAVDGAIQTPVVEPDCDGDKQSLSDGHITDLENAIDADNAMLEGLPEPMMLLEKFDQ